MNITHTELFHGRRSYKYNAILNRDKRKNDSGSKYLLKILAAGIVFVPLAAYFDLKYLGSFTLEEYFFRSLFEYLMFMLGVGVTLKFLGRRAKEQ